VACPGQAATPFLAGFTPAAFSAARTTARRRA
jgi:hypothetical protein